MLQKQNIPIPTQQLGFWLKDWQQRVGLILAANLVSQEGHDATGTVTDEAAILGEFPVKVRAYFERETGTDRWYASDFEAREVSALRAELDAWLRAFGYAVEGLLLERELEPSHAPRQMHLELRCPVHVIRGSIEAVLHGAFERRSAAAWESSNELDLAQWAHRELQAICWKRVPQQTRAELKPQHKSIAAQIREDFCARAVEVGYDVRGFVMLISLDPFADYPNATGARGVA
jgi:hypothetical protein